MTISGVVRVWHEDEGWGVIDSQDTPGGCWAHFSSVLVPGYRALRSGQSVTLIYEPVGQDGFAFRAIEVWPADRDPYRAAGEISGVSDAYRSKLTITFDDPGKGDGA
jgi:cold shock protein